MAFQRYFVYKDLKKGNPLRWFPGVLPTARHILSKWIYLRSPAEVAKEAIVAFCNLVTQEKEAGVFLVNLNFGSAKAYVTGMRGTRSPVTAKAN